MVAVYWDFENIHASLWERAHGRDTWKEQRNYKAEWIVDVKVVMSYVASVAPSPSTARTTTGSTSPVTGTTSTSTAWISSSSSRGA